MTATPYDPDTAAYVARQTAFHKEFPVLTTYAAAVYKEAGVPFAVITPAMQQVLASGYHFLIPVIESAAHLKARYEALFFDPTEIIPDATGGSEVFPSPDFHRGNQRRSNRY